MLRHRLGNTRDAVLGQHQGLQARRERKVGEGGDGIVGEVDALLLLGDAQVLDGGDLVAFCTAFESTSSLNHSASICPFQGIFWGGPYLVDRVRAR